MLLHMRARRTGMWMPAILIGENLTGINLSI